MRVLVQHGPHVGIELQRLSLKTVLLRKIATQQFARRTQQFPGKAAAMAAGDAPAIGMEVAIVAL